MKMNVNREFGTIVQHISNRKYWRTISISNPEIVEAYLNFKENVWELGSYEDATLTTGVPACEYLLDGLQLDKDHNK